MKNVLIVFCFFLSQAVRAQGVSMQNNFQQDNQQKYIAQERAKAQAEYAAAQQRGATGCELNAIARRNISVSNHNNMGSASNVVALPDAVEGTQKKCADERLAAQGEAHAQAFQTQTTGEVRDASQALGGVTGSGTSLSGVNATNTESALKTVDTNIQPQSQEASNKAMYGGILAGGAAAYMGYQASTNYTSYKVCVAGNPKKAAVCKEAFLTPAMLWSAGTVAAGVTAFNMFNAKQRADASVGSVSTAKPFLPDSNENYRNFTQSPEGSKLSTSLDALEKRGIKVDLRRGKATLASGKTISAESLNSPQAMAAAGFSPKDINTLQAMTKEAYVNSEKSLTTDITAGAYGGGNGGAAGAANLDSPPGFQTFQMPGEQKIELSRNPAQVAGMSKTFGEDQIGVSQDDLFAMAERRYQLKAKQGFFLENAAAVTATATSPPRKTASKP